MSQVSISGGTLRVKKNVLWKKKRNPAQVILMRRQRNTAVMVVSRHFPSSFAWSLPLSAMYQQGRFRLGLVLQSSGTICPCLYLCYYGMLISECIVHFAPKVSMVHWHPKLFQERNSCTLKTPPRQWQPCSWSVVWLRQPGESALPGITGQGYK